MAGRRKRWKVLRILAILWAVALVAAVGYIVSQERITGKWFAEESGILVISDDGTLKAGRSPGTYRKVGFAKFEVQYSTVGSGADDIVRVSRRGKKMTWKFPRGEITFTRLPDQGVARVERTVEGDQEARIVRRWIEGQDSQLRVVMADGREGFSDDLLREYLNTEHGKTIDAIDWVREMARWTDSGTVVDSLSEIPGYGEKPLPPEARPTPPETVRRQLGRERESLQVLTYRQFGGVVYLFTCEFDRGGCTSVSRRKLGEDIGEAFHPL